MSKHREIFRKELTPIIKGIALILMFATHVLKTEWMTHPEWIIDITLGGQTLSAILARACDSCIGIFAFITGYSWQEGFDKKKPFARIIGLYISYWVALMAFCLPIRFLVTYGTTGTFQLVHAWNELALSLLAVASPSVSYCWYISFFALAVLTYRPSMLLLKKLRMNGLAESVLLCVVGIAMRFVTRGINMVVPIPDLLMSVLSHYFQWMPVVLIGSLAKRDRLMERLDRLVQYAVGKKIKPWVAVAIAIVVLLIKVFMQAVLNIYSNLDSFFVLPLLYGTVSLSRGIYKRCHRITKTLSLLGQCSLYMWLTHSVLNYAPIQNVLYRLRLPLLILGAALLVMLPVGYGLQKLEQFLKTAVQKLWKADIRPHNTQQNEKV